MSPDSPISPRMADPDSVQWERIHGHIERLDSLSRSSLGQELAGLDGDDGESPVVRAFLRLHYRLPPERIPFQAGQRVGERYRLRHQIGAGGMGVVYLAEQEATGRDVALKLIHPSLLSGAATDRFQEEIRLLGRLEYRSIVRLHDAGIHVDEQTKARQPYYAMELIHGRSLTQHARHHELTRREQLELFLQVCEGTQFAHDRRIVHRDLKPANILVRPDGSPAILDFGLAEWVDGLLPPDVRAGSGFRSGTLAYLSPEQFGLRPAVQVAKEGADVYSLGVILFELLAGTLPYPFPEDASPADIRQIVLDEPARTLGEAGTATDDQLDRILAKSLHKDPAERYQSVAALAKAVGRYLATLPDPAIGATPVPHSSIDWIPGAGLAVPFTQWILEEKLGEGSGGTVWLARHGRLKEARVFKFCPDPEKLRQLKRETTLSRVLRVRWDDPPHIARLLEVSLDDPPYYLAMEYLAGRDLQQWCEHRGGIDQLPESERLELVAQIAEGLQAAHEAGVLHRDLKPSNVLLTTRGGADMPAAAKIADFGVGQLLAPEALGRITRLGFTRTLAPGEGERFAGTYLYLAPEVLAGQPATTRSDLYSLGVLLYQFLVGDFGRPIALGWEQGITDDLLRTDLRDCLAGNPADRPDSAVAVAIRLRNLSRRRAERDQAAREAAERDHQKRRTRRVRRIAAAIAGVLALVAIERLWRAQTRRLELARSEQELRASQEILSGGAGRRARSLVAWERAAEAARDGGAPADLVARLRSQSIATLSTLDAEPLPEEGNLTPPGGRLVAADLLSGNRLVSNPGGLSWLGPDGKPSGTLRDAHLVRGAEFRAGGREAAVAFGLETNLVLGRWTGGTAAIQILARLDTPVPCFAYSPDGRWLAWANASGKVELQALEDGKNLSWQAWSHHLPHRLAFHPSRPWLAAASRDSSSVPIWNYETGALVGTIVSNTPVSSLAWHPMSSRLATAGESSSIEIWRIDTKPLHELTIPGSDSEITEMAYSDTGGLLAVRDANGALSIRDESGSRYLTLAGGGGNETSPGAHSLRIHRGVLAQRTDQGVNSWAIRGDKECLTIPVSERPSALSFSVDGRLLLASLASGYKIWDVASGASVAGVTTPTPAHWSFTRNDWDILESGPFGVAVFGIKTKAGQRDLETQPRWEHLPVPNNTGVFTPWDSGHPMAIAHGSHAHILTPPFAEEPSARTIELGTPPEKLALSHDARWLISRPERRRIAQIWRIAQTPAQQLLELPANDFALTPNSGSLILTHGNSIEALALPESGRRTIIRYFEGARPEAIDLTANGQQLAISLGRSIAILNCSSFITLLTLEPPTPANLRLISISPSGHQVAATTDEGMIIVWQLMSAKQIWANHEFRLPWDNTKAPNLPEFTDPRRSNLPAPIGPNKRADWHTEYERVSKEFQNRPEEMRARLETLLRARP